MIKMIDINERIIFKSVADTEEVKTEFVLRPLTAMEQGKSVLKHEADMQMDGMFDVVKFCLVEIRQGEQVIKDITMDVVNSIPLQVVLEIYNFIMVRNVIGAQDAKN